MTTLETSRRWASRLLALCLVAAVWGAPQPAFAAPGGKGGRARALFFQGTRAFAAKNYRLALHRFRASYGLRPKVVVMFNIAMCQRALGQYNESIESFARYLKQGGRRVKPQRITRVRSLMNHMRTKLGRLLLRVSPAGATVWIDAVRRGKAPLVQPVLLNPGSHRVVVRRKGCNPHTGTVRLKPGQRLTLPITLKKRMRLARLTISTTVRGALIKVNGGRPRRLPVSLCLPAGIHRLYLSAPGHQPRTMAVLLREGQQKSERVKLEPAIQLRRFLARRTRPTSAGIPPVRTTRATPFYRKAWFWSVVGAVVLGAGAAAGYLIWRSTHQQDAFDRTYGLQ